MSRPDYPLVEVEWLDTAKEGLHEWLEPGHVSTTVPTYTTGYLYEDSAVQVVVISTFNADGMCGGKWTIARGAVVAVRKKGRR
jgi:hypothetical protein